MLRFEYDGCNAVLLPMAYDVVAVRTAIELMGSEFCFEGDGCAIAPMLEKECWDGLTDEQLAQRIASRLNAASNLAPF
ncbi:MAG: hypothetical protein NW224_13075 [Leptolyngbyaceae cyanobacterium bins.302]|nr:hypothetical protein [Leptolyngbyaceae cyanobacterium bins.302]